MELLIQGRKIEIGPEAQEYISKKVRKLGRRLYQETAHRIPGDGGKRRLI